MKRTASNSYKKGYRSFFNDNLFKQLIYINVGLLFKQTSQSFSEQFHTKHIRVINIVSH